MIDRKFMRALGEAGIASGRAVFVRAPRASARLKRRPLLGEQAL
jgi:hypothetical protein